MNSTQLLHVDDVFGDDSLMQHCLALNLEDYPQMGSSNRRLWFRYMDLAQEEYVNSEFVSNSWDHFTWDE